jgi:hypothetical protein
LKHLEQSTGKLDEILSVEREISRVREEIERMQGRRNLLQDMTAMTTVTLNLTESRSFVPAANPTFAGRTSHAFAVSLDALRRTVSEAVIAIVLLIPWLVALGTGLLCIWVARRICFRRPVYSRTTHP